MSAPPAVTVAIPSYQRPEALWRCLQACAQQSLMADEVIVCLRRSDSASVALVESVGDKVPFPLRVAFVEDPGHLPPLVVGLSACATPLLAVLDDDAVPRKEWLMQAVETFATYPGLVAVGGPVANHPTAAVPSRTRGYGRTWYGGFAGLPVEGEVSGLLDVAYLYGGNVCYRADALRTIGFDMNLNRGASINYEADLGLGLCIFGKLLFNPEMVIDHYPAQRLGSPARGYSLRYILDYTWNLHYVVSKHTYVKWQRLLFWSYMFLVGQRVSPGLGRLRKAASRLDVPYSELWVSVRRQACAGRAAGCQARRSASKLGKADLC